MLQAELWEAVAEYQQEISAELSRMTRAAVDGQPFDVGRYSNLNTECVLLSALEAVARQTDREEAALKGRKFGEN